MSLLDLLHALPQVLAWAIAGTCALLLIVAACAPRAAALATDDTPSRLDTLDQPTGLTEWDLDHDTDLDDATTLCDAYPHECEWDDVHHTPDPWAPTTRVCLTHHREGADQ